MRVVVRVTLEPEQAASPDEMLEHFKVLRLEPGDVVVFCYPGRLSVRAADGIRERLSEVFPGHTGLILDEGANLGVVRHGDAP